MVTSSITTPAAKEVPFIHELPLIGSQFSLKHDRMNFLRHLARTGEACGFHFGSAPFILFNSPDYVQSVLVKHASDFYSRGRYLRRTFIGQSLFVSDGDAHRRQRKLMTTLFQPRYLSNYTEIMTRYGVQMQQQWSDGETINLNQQMTSLAMNIFGKVLFDIDIAPDAALAHSMDVVFAHSAKTLFSLYAIPIAWPTPYNRQLQIVRQVLLDRLGNALDQRRKNPEATEERSDLLSLLMQATYEDGSKMNDKQVLDEGRALFIAGFETIATALTWTWYLLCQHLEIYQKVQQEVDSVLKGRTPTEADLQHLPYCLQVIKEAMRLYPPAPMIRREAMRDVVIGEYLVPEGTTIILSAYALHHTEKYFPQAEQFDPERFSPEREKEIHRYAYFPFGGGPRVCMGNSFAMMEAHLLLAILVQNVIFTLVPGRAVGFDSEHNLALRPDRKIEVVVKRRPNARG